MRRVVNKILQGLLCFAMVLPVLIARGCGGCVR
jgi:hypothetical protein